MISSPGIKKGPSGPLKAVISKILLSCYHLVTVTVLHVEFMAPWLSITVRVTV